jgi:S1-C subfamily serine protease
MSIPVVTALPWCERRYRRLATAGRLPLVFSLLVGLLLHCRPAAAVNLPKLVEETKLSVVLVSLYNTSGRLVASGSGFFVSGSGRLVTNHHVIEDAAKATATLSDGRVVPITGVLADDPEHDLALLQAEGTDFHPVPLGAMASVHPGDEVVVIGSPLGLSAAISTGIVAAVRDEGLEKERPFDKNPHMKAWGLQITAPISHGSSGSPVFNAGGEVIGVVAATLSEGENVNFAIPVKLVSGLLAGVPPNAVPKPVEGESDAKRSLVISLALIVISALGYIVWTRRDRRAARKRAWWEKSWRRPLERTPHRLN